ncbi:TPA: hypothetical protein DEP21_02410 [Patescibacteria group bacterium]|nr:hypothetical protein [Candidatus Gracilibacteria bacterium]
MCDTQVFLDLKTQAQKKQFSDKTYQILCSDLDEKMIKIAQKNAQQAGVADTISFETRNLLSPISDIQNTTLLCNPPYGKRLLSNDLEKIYKQIINSIQHAN